MTLYLIYSFSLLPANPQELKYSILVNPAEGNQHHRIIYDGLRLLVLSSPPASIDREWRATGVNQSGPYLEGVGRNLPYA